MKRVQPKLMIMSAAIMSLISMPAEAQNWWELPDKEFAEKYRDQAFGDDITGQSEIAWMLFARVNVQVPFGGGEISLWESWPSNDDTFSQARAAFAMNNKVRPQPHFQPSKAATSVPHFKSTPDAAGEEVTRNMISYDYIRGKGLESKIGINRFLSSGKAVDFPVGAVEIKANWVNGARPGAYVFVDKKHGATFSLVGLHIMMKMAPAPKDPFKSERPSWFWTTFEFKDNEGLEHAQSLLTYKDKLSVKQANALLKQAGLGSPFGNYRSNGTQIRFSDKKNPEILLGNTTMEAFAGIPVSGPPSKWTAWNTSCHTCHGSTSAIIQGQSVDFYQFRPILVGKLTEKNAPGLSNYTSMDFVWSIAFKAN